MQRELEGLGGAKMEHKREAEHFKVIHMGIVLGSQTANRAELWAMCKAYYTA